MQSTNVILLRKRTAEKKTQNHLYTYSLVSKNKSLSDHEGDKKRVQEFPQLQCKTYISKWRLISLVLQGVDGITFS